MKRFLIWLALGIISIAGGMLTWQPPKDPEGIGVLFAALFGIWILYSFLAFVRAVLYNARRILWWFITGSADRPITSSR